MLNESIFTDTTINTAGGKQLQAHRAVLSANSPVFHKMFAHSFKEKQSSTIDIVDMSFESCKALLHYMYGSINKDDFSNHRLALLAAANKYGIPGLKDRCEESLLNDIDDENVRERLEEACLYDLSKLKKKCIRHLIDSEKIDNLGQDFFRSADYVLVNEIFQEAREEIRKAKRKKLNT